MPEWHFAGLAGRGRYQHAVVRNILDSPGAGAENNRVSGSDFEDHLFIKLADARTFGRAGEKNSIEAAVGNGAAIDYGPAPRSLAAGELIPDAIPGQARA